VRVRGAESDKGLAPYVPQRWSYTHAEARETDGPVNAYWRRQDFSQTGEPSGGKRGPSAVRLISATQKHARLVGSSLWRLAELSGS